MKLVITGSTGFVGTYFRKYYDSKYDIRTFSFLNNDFEVLKFQNVECIVHLSALVHQMGGASAQEYERVNIRQTL